MNSILIERTANSYLLIIQDMNTGRRNVISVPFEGIAPGYEQETTAVQYLMSLTVPQEVVINGQKSCI